MRRASVLILVVVANAAVLGFYFFTPVFYWYTYPTGNLVECAYLGGHGFMCPFEWGAQNSAVYRSLSCELLGFGAVYVSPVKWDPAHSRVYGYHLEWNGCLINWPFSG